MGMMIKNKLTYYKNRCIHLMNSIEESKGKSMNEVDAELEALFWESADAKDIPSLVYICNQLAKIKDAC